MTTQAATAVVTAAAQRFANQIVAGDFAAQWSELAPDARAEWPSEGARSAMLAMKFSSAGITSISLGHPKRTTWFSGSDPAVNVRGAWRFPLTVSFADATALRPPGVAARFSFTSIYVAYDDATRAAAILGEGPVSIDAPVIVPAGVPLREVHVPIFMYHLIKNSVPPTSEAAVLGTYGWRIEVGLTTLQTQFAAEMRAAHDAGATSISLQI